MGDREPAARPATEDWRAALMQWLTRLALLLGVPTVIFAAVSRPRIGREALLLLLAYAAMVAGLLRARVGPRAKAWIFSAGVTVVGATALFTTGYLPGAALCFTLGGILVGLFGKPRWAFALLGLETLAILVAGWMSTRGVTTTSATMAAEVWAFSTWVRVALAFVSCGAAVIATVVFAVRQVERELAAKTDALARLEQAQEQRLRAERGLLSAQKQEAVGRLAAGVAHDCNNALTVIMGWLHFLEPRLQTDARMSEAVQSALGAARRSADLARRLLALGRRDLRRPRRVAPAAFLASFGSTCERLLPATVRVQVAATATPPILVDEGQLDQVLLNLALNARDAMPDGGDLRLGCSPATRAELRKVPAGGGDAFVLVTVSDTGSGISRDHLERIFEPYFTTKGDVGSGLGLASVEAIMRSSGGEVWVDSQVGQGATFTLCFPAVEGAAEAPELTFDTPSVRPGRRIVLVAEDEEPVRRLMVEVLRDAGYEVLEARDGDEAAAVASRPGLRLDVLCTDGVMPGLRVGELIRRVSVQHPRVRVLVCSGHLPGDGLREQLSAGEHSFLPKPFTPATLVGCVAELLRSKRA